MRAQLSLGRQNQAFLGDSWLGWASKNPVGGPNRVFGDRGEPWGRQLPGTGRCARLAGPFVGLTVRPPGGGGFNALASSTEEEKGCLPLVGQGKCWEILAAGRARAARARCARFIYIMQAL